MNELPWDIKEMVYKYLSFPEKILDEIIIDRKENYFPDFNSRGTVYRYIFRHYSRTMNFFCIKCGNIFLEKNYKTTYYSNHIICFCDNDQWLYLDNKKNYKDGFRLKK